jgi:ABC-type polar amino acid transport system ATPase subunit
MVREAPRPQAVDVSVRPGEVVAVIGPSGSGKSTLLRTINMLEEPTSGHVWFQGIDITDVRTDLDRVRTEMGIVFQQFNLFPHKTAANNITLALRKVKGISEEQALEAATQELRHVGLEEKASSWASSPEDSSSGWPSPARSPCDRSSCFSTR